MPGVHEVKTVHTMLSLRFSSKVRSRGPVSASGLTAFSGGARATSSFSSPSISLMRCATRAGPSCTVPRQTREDQSGFMCSLSSGVDISINVSM